jgi:mannonate dehydratase
MKQTWRWFGPGDVTGIDDILQAGAEEVVSALHHVPPGQVWTDQDIARRQGEIARRRDGSRSGLAWTVVESLWVSEDIKVQMGDWREYLVAYMASLENLARAGIEVVCYNFMPLLDWTRTDLAWRLPHGGTCMRFDLVDFAAFDLHILRRPGGAEDLPADVVAEAAERFAGMSDAARSALVASITAGLPGDAEALSLDRIRDYLDEHRRISRGRFQAFLIDFVSEATPVAERLDLRLCCHPDDPPFPLLGLPRVLSTDADHRAMLDAVDSPANGVTLCSGSLGARPDNDLPGMMRRLGPRVHFLHLRNVRRDSAEIPGSFYESEHLDGDVDLVALIAAVLREEARRTAEGRADRSIPFRPDHGQDVLDDLKRKAQPGYPTIGRLKGLAELRGVMRAYAHPRAAEIANLQPDAVAETAGGLP